MEASLNRDFLLPGIPAIQAAGTGDITKLSILFVHNRQFIAPMMDDTQDDCYLLHYDEPERDHPRPRRDRILFRWDVVDKRLFLTHTSRPPFMPSYRGTHPASIVAYAMASARGNRREDLRLCLIYLACWGCNPNRKSRQDEVPRQFPTFKHLACNDSANQSGENGGMQ